MTEPLQRATGLGVLHLFCRPTPLVDRSAVVAAVTAAREGGDQVVPFALLGHKGDLGFMALSEDLWRLRSFQTAVQAAGLDVGDSYVSLTEISEYAQGVP